MPMHIEPLEARIAPAVLINPLNPKLATYIDVDGDKVTIANSLGAFTNANFMSVNRGTVGGEQLLLIDLHHGGFDNANLTISVVKVKGGDGLGRLGALTVKGDIVGANVYVSGAGDGDLGPVRVGGSLIGDQRANSGQIQSTGDMGPVTIGGDLVGGECLSKFARAGRKCRQECRGGR